MPVLVKLTEWEKRRSLFSDEERDVLNANIVGQVLCPRGCTVKVNEATRPILLKLGIDEKEDDE